MHSDPAVQSLRAPAKLRVKVAADLPALLQNGDGDLELRGGRLVVLPEQVGEVVSARQAGRSGSHEENVDVQSFTIHIDLGSSTRHL